MAYEAAARVDVDERVDVRWDMVGIVSFYLCFG